MAFSLLLVLQLDHNTLSIFFLPGALGNGIFLIKVFPFDLVLIPVWNRQALTHFIQCPCFNSRLGLPIETLVIVSKTFLLLREIQPSVKVVNLRVCPSVSRTRAVTMSSQT